MRTANVLTFAVILILAACFYRPAGAYGAAPAGVILPGVQEINLPASLNTNVAVINGRADGPHVKLAINGCQVDIGEDGRFAAEVYWPRGAGGRFVLEITSETNGAYGALTHEIPYLPAQPVLYFTATESTNEGFAVLSGRVNTFKTSALIAAVIPPVKDGSILDTSFPGRTFLSGAAETVITSPLENSWLRLEEEPEKRAVQEDEKDREKELQIVPWKVGDTTFYVPFGADGSFSTCVPLFAGPNTIVLAAVTPEGKVYSQARQCYYDFPLTLTPLPEQTGRSLLVLSGTTRPGNRVEVNVSFKTSQAAETSEQHEATVLADGRWYAPVILHPGENRISVAVSEEISLWSGKSGRNIVHQQYYVTPQTRTVKYVPYGAHP